MSLGRDDALASARKLVRMLDSAPDPLRQAQAAISLLTRESGWSAGQEQQILELAGWLSRRPPPGAIKLRCQAVLRSLA